MTSIHLSTGWRFWGAWGLAFLGFPLGGLAAIGLVGGVESILEGAIGGAACGAVLGGVQWLVLRRRLLLSPSWIVATSLGMAGGLALTLALFGTSTAGSVLLLRCGKSVTRWLRRERQQAESLFEKGGGRVVGLWYIWGMNTQTYPTRETLDQFLTVGLRPVHLAI